MLTNTLVADKGIEDEDCIFQVGMNCKANTGKIGTYPKTESLLTTNEEAELRLRYDYEKVFAIGHGCAGEWDGNEANRITVRSEFIPTVNVPPTKVIVDENSSILSLAFLRDSPIDDLESGLENFVQGYEEWLNIEKSKVADEALHDEGKEATQRIFIRIELQSSGCAQV